MQICRMANELNERGHDVWIVANRDPKHSIQKAGEETDSWQSCLAAGISLRTLPLNSWRGQFSLRRLIRDGGYDIAHAHRDTALVAAWRAVRKLKRPALVAQRGTIFIPPSQPQRALCSPHTKAIIAVAHAVKEVLTMAVGVDSAKVFVVHGSVELDRFSPRPKSKARLAELGIEPDAPVIGSLSAYRRRKGFDIFLQALAPVLCSHPNAQAVFLGQGVSERVEPEARKMGISKQCHFIGHRTDVAEWISIMDLTVVAAVKGEGLSGVLRESLSMEVPVISSNCAGNREIVEDGKTGLLIPPGDVGALTAALNRALIHPEEMKAMAKRGRRWVEAHCSCAKQATRLEEIYQSVLQNPREIGETNPERDATLAD